MENLSPYEITTMIGPRHLYMCSLIHIEEMSNTMKSLASSEKVS